MAEGPPLQGSKCPWAPAEAEAQVALRDGHCSSETSPLLPAASAKASEDKITSCINTFIFLYVSTR